MVPFPVDDREYSVETRDTLPAHLLTTIDSFSMLSEHEIQTLESSVFEAGDYKWKVTFNLDGDEHISAYLSVVGTSSLPAGWEVNAVFNFYLYNHISNNYVCFRGKARRFLDIDREWGFSKLMSKNSLREPINGYIFKDKCVFGAEVFVIKKQKPLIQKVSVLKLSDPYKRSWKISGFSKLEGIWKSEEFSVGGYKWNINMYPNGNGKACGRHVSIYLNCVDAESFHDGKKVKAAYVFCFRNILDDQKHHTAEVRGWFTSSEKDWGFSEFIAIGNMRDPSKGFVVGDCCDLEIQLSVLALQE